LREKREFCKEEFLSGEEFAAFAAKEKAEDLLVEFAAKKDPAKVTNKNEAKKNKNFVKQA